MGLGSSNVGVNSKVIEVRSMASGGSVGPMCLKASDVILSENFFIVTCR